MKDVVQIFVLLTNSDERGLIRVDIHESKKNKKQANNYTAVLTISSRKEFRSFFYPVIKALQQAQLLSKTILLEVSEEEMNEEVSKE